MDLGAWWDTRDPDQDIQMITCQRLMYMYLHLTAFVCHSLNDHVKTPLGFRTSVHDYTTAIFAAIYIVVVVRPYYETYITYIG